MIQMKNVALLSIIWYLGFWTLVICSLFGLVIDNKHSCDFSYLWVFLLARIITGVCVFFYFTNMINPRETVNYWHIVGIITIQLAFSVWGILIVTNVTKCFNSLTYVSSCIHIGIGFLSVLVFMHFMYTQRTAQYSPPPQHIPYRSRIIERV